MILYRGFCESLEGLSGTSFARAVGISRRTMGRWRKRNGCLEDRSPQPKERPRTTSLFDFVSVYGAYRRFQGEIGGRVIETLTGVSHATADRILAPFREPRPEDYVEPRTTVSFLAPGVAYSIDGVTFKTAHGFKVEPAAVQDECSRCRLGLLVAPTLDEASVERFLEEIFILYGPPLVFKADHGAPFYHSHRFRAFLLSWGVLLLPSPPHWPQYNGKKERAIWELECHVRRTPGWPFITARELYRAFGHVMMSLNHEFPRPILGGKTSHRILTETPRPTIRRAELRKEVDDWGQAIHEVCPNLRGGEPLYARWAITCALINRGLLKIEGPKLLPFFKSQLGQRL